MKFVLHRTRTICSVQGHAIEFIKGQLTHVPPSMHAEVMAAGAIPEHEIEDPELGKDEAREPTDPQERQNELFNAFEAITLRGRREDFTAAGAPHAKALEAALGWRVEAKERDTAWVAFKTKES